MAKPKSNAKPKPPVKRAQKKPVPKRASVRLRQHPPKKQPQKVRPPMTTIENANDSPRAQAASERAKEASQPRGTTLTGKAAVRNREHDKDDDKPDYSNVPFAEGKTPESYAPDSYKEGKEFPEGDAAAGKPDFEERANQLRGGAPRAQRDVRAYLKDQAEKNEAANDEVNAQFLEGERRTGAVAGIILDPDYQRDMSLQSTLATLGGDTDAQQRRVDAARAIRIARENAALPGGRPKVEEVSKEKGSK
jgi:hypothetical protein